MDRQIPREILVAAIAMDRPAFHTIVELCQTWVYGMAYRMTYNRADAEDISQEIFLRLYRGLPRYNIALPFIPWFRRLATNTCLNYLRSQRRRAPLDAGAEIKEEVADAPRRTSDDRILLALNRLPAEYRMAIALRYFEEMAVDEIAGTMELPVGTVKTWLFRARNELKGFLKEKRHDLS